MMQSPKLQVAGAGTGCNDHQRVNPRAVGRHAWSYWWARTDHLYGSGASVR